MREIRSKLDTYYGQELERLRSLAAEFARTHPASAAPLQGPLAGPETERLLEGVAFLTGLIREKLDDEFPEFVQALMELIFPFYLRPVPSISVVAFSSKPGFERTISVPAGTGLPPILVDGSPCRFRTCFDLEVHPLEVLYVGAKAEGNQLAQINMALRLSGLTLKEWQPKGLSFMLGGPVSLGGGHQFSSHGVSRPDHPRARGRRQPMHPRGRMPQIHGLRWGSDHTPLPRPIVFRIQDPR